MNLFLFQAEIGWEKWIGEGVAITLILVILGFILRLLPSWKEIKLAEITVRGEEAKAQVQVATALGGLGNALNQIGSTMHSVAIEQRRATDNIKVLQRATADENNNILQSVDNLMERMDTFEKQIQEQNATQSERN